MDSPPKTRGVIVREIARGERALRPRNAAASQAQDENGVEFIAGMEPLLPGKAFDGFQGMPSHLKKLAPVEPFNGAVDHRREDPMKGAPCSGSRQPRRRKARQCAALPGSPGVPHPRGSSPYSMCPGRTPVGTLKVAHSGVDHHEEVVPGTKDAAGGAQAGARIGGKKVDSQRRSIANGPSVYAAEMTAFLNP